MSIDPNVGALKEYLTDIATSHTYNKVKDDVAKGDPQAQRLYANEAHHVFVQFACGHVQ